jgi:osomolarity two-component system, sensor histidine kinase SLN1
MGEQEEAIATHLRDHPDVEGVVIGDEARFRQIVNNLARSVHVVRLLAFD